MVIFVGSSVAFVIFFSLLILHIYRKKSAIKNLQKISLFQNQIKVFSSEFDSLLKSIVTKKQEDEFAAKWQNLYSELVRCSIPKKNAAFSFQKSIISRKLLEICTRLFFSQMLK